MSKISAYRRAYGQFFTPGPVVACCYALLAGRLSPSPRVADPACGDGAFLRYAAAHGLAAAHDLHGCDVDAALVSSLTGAGLPNVRCADGLDSASLPAATFELVVGNPPYGVALGPHDGRPLASEARFLLRALDLARPGGYVALVLPSGVLANERLRPLRAELVERCTLLAVVTLPRAAFRHAGTNAACSILLLRNAPAPPDHRVFFALPDSLGDLPAIVKAFHDRRPPIEEPRTTQRIPGRESETSQSASDQEPRTDERNTQLPREYPTRNRFFNSQFSILNSQFWLSQTTALAQRMDAYFWRPDFRLALDRMAARHDLRPLGGLVGRHGLIVGDHVRPSRGEARGAGLPYEYYQTREFMPAGYNYGAIERCDERAYRRLSRTTVRQGDILVSCAGVGGAGQGRVCLVTHRPGPSCTGDVFILRPEQPDPIYLFLFLGSRCGRAQLLRLQNGVGTVNLSADELLQVQVPFLPDAAQRAFAARYALISAAHDAAMAALARGDSIGFARERARSEALLDALRCNLEEIMLGG
jgi:predicted RNA methylase